MDTQFVDLLDAHRDRLHARIAITDDWGDARAEAVARHYADEQHALAFPVRLWALADDPDTYGVLAGQLLVVSADGETELAGPFPSAAEAYAECHARGWRIAEDTWRT